MGKIAEKGSYLIVESLDRVSRNEILDALDLFLSIIKAGVAIVTLSDGHVYDKAKITANFTDLIISLSIMSRAHEESSDEGDETRCGVGCEANQEHE